MFKILTTHQQITTQSLKKCCCRGVNYAKSMYTIYVNMAADQSE